MFQNFQAWKLHSFEDYLTFLIIILAGIMIFKFAIQKIYKHRNDAYALKLVRKKLKYFFMHDSSCAARKPAGGGAGPGGRPGRL